MSVIIVQEQGWEFNLTPGSLIIKGFGLRLESTHSGLTPDQIYGFALGWAAFHTHPATAQIKGAEMSNTANQDWN